MAGRGSAGAVGVKGGGQPAVLRGPRAAPRRTVLPRPEEQSRRTPRHVVPYRVGGTAVAQPLARAAESRGPTGQGPDDPRRRPRALGGNRNGARGGPCP